MVMKRIFLTQGRLSHFLLLVDAGWWNAARLATGAECSEFVGGRNMAGGFCCRDYRFKREMLQQTF